MNEIPKHINCDECKNNPYCMPILSKVFEVLRRLGIEDFNLYINKCSKFDKKGGDDLKDNPETKVRDIFKTF